MRYSERSDILTVTGNYFDFISPESSDFGIAEIAHGLSNVCRFAGQCRSFYSVAQHSVLVSRIVPIEHAVAGLLHDAAEAFIGDVARPLKRILPDYKAIEKRVEDAVFGRFGLPPTLPQCVKYADLVLLATEQRDLMPKNDYEWACLSNVVPLPDIIIPWSQSKAHRVFLQRYNSLMRGSVMCSSATASGRTPA